LLDHPSIIFSNLVIILFTNSGICSFLIVDKDYVYVIIRCSFSRF